MLFSELADLNFPAQVLVGLPQLGRALLDPQLQLLVRLQQGPLRPHTPGDVAHRRADDRDFNRRPGQFLLIRPVQPDALDADVEDGPVLPLQLQIACISVALPGRRACRLPHARQVLPPPGPVLGGNVAAHLAPDQPVPRGFQQRGAREVRLHDPALAGEGEVTHRAKLVEIEVAVPGNLQLQVSPLQFLVLHPQLELMHLELVDNPLRILALHLRRRAGGPSQRLRSSILPHGALISNFGVASSQVPFYAFFAVDRKCCF